MSDITGYDEATVIWDGAMDECVVFPDGEDPKLFDLWFWNIKQDALKPEAGEVEVYLMRHDHDPELDCECSQYVRDGNPYWSNHGD